MAQIRIDKLKKQVNILIITGFVDVNQSNNVVMVHLTQKDYFTVSALAVS